MKIAIANAEKLKKDYGTIPHIFEVNPYTTVDELVKMLISTSEK